MSTVPVIAIVEDDPSMRDALCELLQSAGYDDRGFADAATFLAAHEPRRFDLVITDLRMPGMDGLELQRRLRMSDPDVPVIVVTSFDDAAVRARAMAGGAVAFLTKPVAAAILFAQIRAALEGRPVPPDGQ